MMWLSWRQFRLPAVVVGAIVAALALLLVVFQLPSAAVDALALFNQLTGFDETIYYVSLLAMYGIPGLIGIFWGAPLITRELETGTYRLAWNQTVTRGRWLTVKLGMAGLAAMAVSGLASLAVTWWASPIDSATGQEFSANFGARIEPVTFAARGIVPIGYAAFAFILGVAVGVLLKRTVAAMAVTLVVYIAVQLAVPLTVRPYMMPPNTDTVAITEESITMVRINSSGRIIELGVENNPGAWLLSNATIDANGNQIKLGEAAAIAECTLPTPSLHTPPPPEGHRDACFAKLTSLGYRQEVTYQPASRFWALQGIETAFYLVLTALLTWLTFRVVGKRLS